MRPFLTTLLKCKKCGVTEVPRITIEKAERIEMPANIPNLSELNIAEDAISSIADVFMSYRPSIFSADEEELLCQMLESNSAPDSQMVEKILFGTDVISGNILCTSCGTETRINSSILEMV